MDEWTRIVQDYPNSDTHTHMTDSGQSSEFIFEAAENGICTIRLIDKITADLASAVAQQVVTHISAHGLPTGILLDARSNEQFSIVRLSSLVDTLSGMGAPLAVVFSGRDQQMLADLLHNTLAQKDYVAYFTDPESALGYLLSSASRNTPDDLH